MQKTRVLVPVDLSPLGEAILPYVRHGIEAPYVVLLHVVPGSTDAEAEADTASWERLREAGGRAFGESLEMVKPVVRGGKPAPTITAVAREHGVDLIALTTHGRTGFDRLVLGSVAEAVIRSAPVPVLALRAEKPGAPGPAPKEEAEGSEAGGTAASPEAWPSLFDRVLIPHDGSANARRALDALARFDVNRTSKVTILGVADGQLGADTVAHEVLQLKERLFAFADEVRRAGFHAHTIVEAGAPALRILEHAESLPASLVAMATHGRTGPSRWLLGSVTEKVLRATAHPLLICR
jgi:nucleotide-binding universal stress UspA family protein